MFSGVVLPRFHCVPAGCEEVGPNYRWSQEASPLPPRYRRS
ncbi:hypothetical protein Taro_020390 [Colocasia esculenta]|uniref:Uncharacterized protein n=1 Tax=Colocasia esculenta TaxID=4460 RepID=A0A843UW84_COLES|nr:hypothetical protein [Colocasia esculenta]